MRMLTELDGKGEKGIKSLKKQIHGLCQSWSTTAAKKCLREKSLRGVARAAAFNLTNEEQQEASTRLMLKALGLETQPQNDNSLPRIDEEEDEEDMDGGSAAEEDAFEDDCKNGEGWDDLTSEMINQDLLNDSESEDILFGSKRRRHGHKRHKSREEVLSQMASGEVVSMVRLHSDKFGVVCKERKKSAKMVQIEVGEWSSNKCGADCFRWQVSLGDHQDCELTEDGTNSVKDNCLLLPRLGKHGTVRNSNLFRSEFCMITDKWTEMVRSKGIIIPEI